MATLEAKGLRIGYDKNIIVTIDSLALTKPEIVSIIGPNGSGKSTLLKGLARLLPLAGGEVHLDGKNMRDYSASEIARKIAVLPQSAMAPADMNVFRLVSCGRNPHMNYFAELSDTDYEVIEHVMKETDVWKYRDRTMGALSGGERQRVWLAMTLAQDPEILMLDEPTTYLDIHHQMNLMDVIDMTWRHRSMTIVMVLHDLNQAARYSHRMWAMKDGKLVGDDTPEKVLTEDHIRDWFGVKMRPVHVQEEDKMYRFYLPLEVQRQDKTE